MISSLHAKKFRMLFEQNIASNITRNHVKPWNCTKLCITAQNHQKLGKITPKPRKTNQKYAKSWETTQNNYLEHIETFSA